MLTTDLRAISIEQFYKVGLTIAQALSVKNNPKAKIPAYLLEINLGETLSKEHHEVCNKQHYISSAQLCSNHSIDEIAEQQLMCVYNFPRKQIGKMMSDCLVTGAQKEAGTYESKQETTIFIKPSKPVPLGAKIGLFAEKELYVKNDRKLSWDEFTALDLRIGTILSIEKNKVDLADNHEKKEEEERTYDVKLDLGETLGTQHGIVKVSNHFEKDHLLGLQVMVLTNLDLKEIKSKFPASQASVVVCTIAGDVFLQPAKEVANGYKIA